MPGWSQLFQVNGTTYTATGVSDKNADGSLKEVSITTMDDYDGIYDTIRDFFKQYNGLINEMDKLYNAESSKGYEPLLSEEKEALTDTEVEEWEKKIKDSLLRKDSSLSSVISSMTTTMMGSISVNGKDMYLSSFGIATLGYFNAEDNEKHAYHIAGDPNDTSVAEGKDILKSMIASDPETVKSFFSQMANNLYKSMGTTLERIPDFTKAFAFTIYAAFGIGIYAIMKYTSRKRLHRKGVEHGSARWANENECKKLADKRKKLADKPEKIITNVV